MENIIILQIIIGICFAGIVITLFIESKDYLTYAVVFLFISGVSIYLLCPSIITEEPNGIILAVDWNVILFLFCIFSIIEILNDRKVFHEIALKIVTRFKGKPRFLFYSLCLTSTMLATVIEDLSIALIFVPIVIEACRNMKINPTPYLFGVTICINLASTLTPFGSAENIIIANHFNLSLHWHLINLGLYFIFTLFLTLFLLDRILLSHFIKKSKVENNHHNEVIIKKEKKIELLGDDNPFVDKMLHRATLQDIKQRYIVDPTQTQVLDNDTLVFIETPEPILDFKIDKKSFRKNLIGLVIFLIFLIAIPNIVISGVLGLLLFTFLNPIEIFPDKRPEASVSTYLHRIDAKLIYFFIILFIMVYFLSKVGLTTVIEKIVEKVAHHDTLTLAIGLLIITSVISGFLDNAPITILFLPIIQDLISTNAYLSNPLFIAFTLGINLGGNFLPQGAACDMMTLEIARKNNVKEFTYKNLTIVGGLFALLHVLLGIGYIYLYLLFF